MRLHEKAREMHNAMLELLKTGIPVEEVRVTQEVPIMVMLSECLGIQPAGKTLLFYELIDPESQNSDAQLVRAEVWKREDCGALKAVLDQETVILAKVNPDECIDVERGWITEKGEFVLRR